MTRDSRIAAAILALAASLYLFVGPWVPQAADVEVGFQATRAIATRGSLALEPDTPSTKRILAFGGGHGDAYNCRKGTDGRQYPYWGLAYVAAGVPFYFAGHALDAIAPETSRGFESMTFTPEGLGGSEYFARAAVLLLPPLLGAATLALLYLAARRLRVAPAPALLAALTLGFATSCGVETRSGLSDTQAVFAIALALERALAARETGRARDLLLCGLAMGFGILTKLHAGFAFVGIGLIPLTGDAPLGRRIRALAILALGALPFVATFFLANYVRWGNAFITGYEKSSGQAWFWIPLWKGLPALLFAPAKGVAPYAFALLFPGLVGLALLARRRERALAAALALSIFGGLAMPASTIEWHGAWSFGPRYAAVAFPALTIGAALAFGALAARRRIWLGIALAALGFATVLPGFFTSTSGAISVAFDGARVKWPDANFPSNSNPAERDQQRFQDLCFESGPLNFLRIQHALGRRVLTGSDDAFGYREDLGVERDGATRPPNVVELNGAGSIGWVGFRTVFGGSVVLAFPVVLALVVAFAALRLARLLARADDRGDPPPLSTSSTNG